MNDFSYKNRKYNIVPYDPAWVDSFFVYASKLRKIFGDNIQIEHIGSTSVPSMYGKPCIDVLVIVNDMDIVENHIPDMKNAGFECAGEFVTKNSRLFRVMKDQEILANIHFFPAGHPHNKEMLDLRDYLRKHPKEVEEYSNVKKELYFKYKSDYASYRKCKDEYMKKLKERVK